MISLIHKSLDKKILFWQLGFTCKRDDDCHQGYCEKEEGQKGTGKCVCLYGSAYEEDCSFYGCEFYTFN